MSSANDIQEEIRVKGQKLGTVISFKYFGAAITYDGSKPEVLSRIAQATAALTKRKPIWIDSSISVRGKVKLMRSLVISILLYACESWTFIADLKKERQAFEMRCCRRLLNILYNEEVRRKIQAATEEYDELLFLLKKGECDSTCADIPHGKLAPFCDEYVLNKCKYSCDENYKINEKVGTFVTCVWGEWTPYNGPWRKDELCIPITCPTTLPNGEISENCPATAGSTCEYSCAAGYWTKLWVYNITCQPSTRWTTDPHTLCINDQQCDYEEIPNGDLDLTCRRIPGEGCTYTCRLGYHALDGSSVVICGSDSKWSRPLLSLCKRNSCSRTIPNGVISERCNLQPGDYCGYACNSGYTKSRLHEVLKCNASGQWEWDRWKGSFCDKIPTMTTQSPYCPRTIRNGNILLNCDRLPYTRCTYTCHAGCSAEFSDLYCSSRLEWSKGFYACYCQDTTTYSSNQNIVPTGSVVGIIVGMLVLLLIVFICVWYIRKSKQDRASYDEPVTYHGSRITATVPDGQTIGVASPAQTELQRALLYEPSHVELGYYGQQQPQTAGSTHIHIPPENNSAPKTEPSAPPVSSAPPPSYEEVICNPSEYKA